MNRIGISSDDAVKFIEDDQFLREYHKGSSFGEIFVFNECNFLPFIFLSKFELHI